MRGVAARSSSAASVTQLWLLRPSRRRRVRTGCGDVADRDSPRVDGQASLSRRAACAAALGRAAPWQAPEPRRLQWSMKRACPSIRCFPCDSTLGGPARPPSGSAAPFAWMRSSPPRRRGRSLRTIHASVADSRGDDCFCQTKRKRIGRPTRPGRCRRSGPQPGAGGHRRRPARAQGCDVSSGPIRQTATLAFSGRERRGERAPIAVCPRCRPDVKPPRSARLRVRLRRGEWT
jgi:hypothetical protein